MQHIVGEGNMTIFRTKLAGYSIELIRSSSETFTVVYGKQREINLTYDDAAKELGYCILHALQCEGKLD